MSTMYMSYATAKLTELVEHNCHHVKQHIDIIIEVVPVAHEVMKSFGLYCDFM